MPWSKDSSAATSSLVDLSRISCIDGNKVNKEPVHVNSYFSDRDSTHLTTHSQDSLLNSILNNTTTNDETDYHMDDLIDNTEVSFQHDHHTLQFDQPSVLLSNSINYNPSTSVYSTNSIRQVSRISPKYNPSLGPSLRMQSPNLMVLHSELTELSEELMVDNSFFFFPS